MKSEFALAFNQICSEYNLPRDIVLDAVRAALVTAYRRDWNINQAQNVTADINIETGATRVYLEKRVVEEVEDPQEEIELSQAKQLLRNAEVGDPLMVDVTPRDFGRIAAQTAKQVIMQRLREAERDSQFARFSRQEDEIIVGTVQSVNPQGVTLHLERTEEAFMPKREQIPGERYGLHRKIRVYVTSVRRTPRGPEITVSRSHPRMLGRLLELEVPEIRNGQVEIKAIAREAGARSKVAVASRQPGLDPVGACVGLRGIRIQTISRELHGERVDVIEWDEDPALFIANALSLNPIESVVLDETHPGGRTASVVVLEDQLSLAIGRAGQNARLAAKLTGWRVDIQGATEAALWALEEINKTPELLETCKDVAPLVPRLASIMRLHETERYPYTDEERRIIKTVIEGVRAGAIARRDREQAHPVEVQGRARRAAQESAEAQRQEALASAQARVPQHAYAMQLAELGLSNKVLGHLERNDLQNAGQVMERMALGDEALLMLNGIGIKALSEIKEAVAASELTFVDTEAEPEAVVADVVEPGVDAPTPPMAEVAAADAPVALEMPEEITEEIEPEVAVADEDEIALVADEAPLAELEESAVPEEEADEDTATVDLLATVDLEALEIDALEELEEFEDEDELDGDQTESGKKGKQQSRRRRALVFDEDTGETYAVRRRRRTPGSWDDYLG